MIRFIFASALACVLVIAPVAVRSASAQTAAPQATSTDRYVTVNGSRLHYLDWGAPTKPAMILIHGIARHAHTFDHIAPDFARDYHVVAY